MVLLLHPDLLVDLCQVLPVFDLFVLALLCLVTIGSRPWFVRSGDCERLVCDEHSTYRCDLDQLFMVLDRDVLVLIVG